MADDRSNDLAPGLKFYNVLLLGITFMLIFTGFQTCGMIEQTVLNSYTSEHSSFHADGFTSLAIIYAVFAAANWIAPSIVSIIGPKCSMILSGFVYTLYIATFIKPIAATLYVGSVLIGIGAAVIWTAQGNFLTLNSDDMTMGRNSGLFWAILQCSLLFGNLYVYFAWRGVTTISDAERIPLYIGLTAVSGIGTLCMFFLRSHKKSPPEPSLLEEEENDSQEYVEQEPNTAVNVVSSSGGKAADAWHAFKRAIELFKTPDMLMLSVTFLYTGLELTFFSGVYTTCVGATLELGADADRLVGLTGIMIGVGEILGGASFGIFGKHTVKFGREPVILLGMTVHVAAFFLIFLNIPNAAPFGKTHDTSYISPNEVLAVSCGLLLGFGDACFNTQCFSILGVMYPEDSAPAFALFKFEQSLAAAIGFFYSIHIGLKWQLLILVLVVFPGSLCFFRVEKRLQLRQSNRENM